LHDSYPAEEKNGMAEERLKGGKEMFEKFQLIESEV